MKKKTYTPDEIDEFLSKKGLHLTLDDLSANQDNDINLRDWWKQLSDDWKYLLLYSYLREYNILYCDKRHHRINTLEPLRALKKLERFNCIDQPVIDLEPLSGLTNLTHLDISGTDVQSLEPLRHLEHLKLLKCSRTQITDLEPIGHLKKLTYLSCFRTNINSLQPIKELTNLKTLYCYTTKVKDLKPLSKLSNLTQLNISNTRVKDLTPLKNLKNLGYIRALGTDIPTKEIEKLNKALPNSNIISEKEHDQVPLTPMQNGGFMDLTIAEEKSI